MKPGIHLIHKPIGPTSFSVLRELAPANRRSCHGGTLDPFASGLLLILIEPATQLFDLLHDVPKVYEATIAWGLETDNGDPTGAVISREDSHHLDPSRIAEAAFSFIGWHEQVPPITSAKRIDG
ncbi:MAG: tRNA pseudouridine(55) synthase, partial [Phycisphaerae bacterium]|nr:tRNA pseudouridine(55) synthase [Phycisphaerae bacterium]